MVQGGYVSQSSSKTLTVQKKSNVLDKKPPGGKGNALNSSNAANNNNSQSFSSSIDVSRTGDISNRDFLTNQKLPFFCSLNKSTNPSSILTRPLQESVLKEFTDELKKQTEEMRKLKSIIVKHENRIRSLEASLKSREEDVLDSILYTDKRDKGDNNDATSPADVTKAPSAGNLAPDEV